MKKGFTLIELLFVMAIVAILAGIGITQMSGSTESAIEVTMKNDARNIILKQQEYFMENGAYYKNQ